MTAPKPAAWGVVTTYTRLSFYVARSIYTDDHRSTGIEYLRNEKGRVKLFRSKETAQTAADAANNRGAK